MSESPVSRNRKSYWILAGIVALLGAGLVLYSQIDAFAWDEGFHLLTAQLITRGKRPYLDFNFSQTPLNAYWNAFWMVVFGQTWHTAHAVAAIMTTGAVWLSSGYVFARFPVDRWRLPGAVMTALMMGLNVLILQFGAIAQAYGLALFLIVAAFRVTVSAVDRKGLFLPAAAGFLSSAAAGATLLTAPVCPVLAIWMGFQNRAGNRWSKLAALAAAAVIPFIPVIDLFAKGPRQTYFNIVQYNLIYRQVEWSGAISHDVGVILSWVHSAQALLTGILALVGLLFIRLQSDWAQKQRAEFYLCGWLALALGFHISSAHPTFQRYYIFALPFVTILAIPGIYSLSTRLLPPHRVFVGLVALVAIFSVELFNVVRERDENMSWYDLEKIARKVDQVTPAGGVILSDEAIYFLTRRPPPSGMELADSHKLDFPAEKAAPLHLVSESEIKKQIRAGRFATAVDCQKGHKINENDFKPRYRQKQEFGDCTVYWDWRG